MGRTGRLPRGALDTPLTLAGLGPESAAASTAPCPRHVSSLFWRRAAPFLELITFFAYK